MKGLPYSLLCYLALCSSVFASVPVKKHDVLVYKDKVYKDAVFVNPSHFEIIGAGGIANLRANSISNLGVTSSERDRLFQTNSDSWETTAGQFGLGYVYYFGNAQPYPDHIQWFSAVEPELNVYYLASNSIKGKIWRFNSSTFNDLTFDIPVHSTRLMLDVALTVATWQQFSIYAKAGLGNAWNQISYKDKDADSSVDPCPKQRVSLHSNTRSSFVWEAGAGMAYAFNDRIGLSLEYLYADLGSARTSSHGNTGTITAPVIVPVHLNLEAQTALLGLHVAL